MTAQSVAILTLLILAAATLYASVGHGGGSGYLAAMALFGVAPVIMKPTALCLNVLVASIVTLQFARAGCFSGSLLWRFAITSVPAAYLGGAVTLPGAVYRPLVGAVLLFAAFRLLFARSTAPAAQIKQPTVLVGLVAGAAVGLLAGLTGTGGGIFLTPLLLFMGWADNRQAAGVSAAFILVNSLAGLAGLISRWQPLPAAIPLWAVAAVVGGLVGSYYGSRRLQNATLRRLLGLVLVVAGLKLLLAAG